MQHFEKEWEILDAVNGQCYTECSNQAKLVNFPLSSKKFSEQCESGCKLLRGTATNYLNGYYDSAKNCHSGSVPKGNKAPSTK
jgi:hypothetical protein